MESMQAVLFSLVTFIALLLAVDVIIVQEGDHAAYRFGCGMTISALFIVVGVFIELSGV